MNRFLSDCRHAVRLYSHTPGASLIAVFVLAVGMAFVGAFLSLYVDLAIEPHRGFEQGGRLATIGYSDGTSHRDMPYAALDRMAEEMTSIEAVAMLDSRNTLIGPEAEESVAVLVTEDFFDGLRPRVVLGRGFRVEQHAPDAEAVVLLSYRYWQERFDGDRNVLGTSLEIARDPRGYISGPSDEPEPESARYRIIGVMSEALSDTPYADAAVWLPLEQAYPLFVASAQRLPNARAFRTLVRRRAGVSTQAVRNEFSARFSGEGGLDDWFSSTYSIDAIDGVVSSIPVQRDAKRQLELLLVCSLLLAFVAAANVSLFLLARAPGRRRELGIRLAVGAPIRRLGRQLATESALLVVSAAAMGLLMSLWLATILRELPVMREADWRDITLLDWRVLGIAASVVLVLALLVSLAPIMQLKRHSIAVSSQHVTARASLAQRLTGTAQVAVAGAIGAAAIAFGWYLGSLMLGDQGYELAGRFWSESLEVSPFAGPDGRIVELVMQREAVEAIPGVIAVAYGFPLPVVGVAGSGAPSATIAVPSDVTRVIEALVGVIEEPFIEVFELTVLHGYVPDLESRDTAGAVINQTLARALWGRDDVVGERIPEGSSVGGLEVVGVLEDVSFDHPSAAVPPYVWPILGDWRGAFPKTVIQSQLTAAELRRELERIASAGEIEAPRITLESLTERYDWLTGPDRVRGLLTMMSAALVVFLTAFGFYGTQRYLVARGRRELAIRASIGAGPRAIGRLVLRRALLLGMPGIVIGGLLGYSVVNWLRDGFIPREISATVVTVWLIVGLVLLLIAATLGPAREAKRTLPGLLLRD